MFPPTAGGTGLTDPMEVTAAHARPARRSEITTAANAAHRAGATVRRAGIDFDLVETVLARPESALRRRGA